MNNDPLVTVYLVNHNYGRFIRQAIDSVLKQTMTDWELLIIDDGSTDDSREILEEFTGHPKIQIILQQNQGLNITNNIAIRAARGKYLMRLDADDYLDSHALQVMSGVLEREEDIGLVFPDYYHVDVDGEVQEVVRRHDFDKVDLFDQPAHGACTMSRRVLLKEIGGYDEEFRCQDGWDIWIRFIEKYKVQNVNLPLFYYRQHGSSLTRDEQRILATRAEILKKGMERQEADINSVAVIPIRGQKADLHSPAMRKLGGKPLMEWTVDAALESQSVSRVIVTSPDEEILDHIRKRYGDKVLAVARRAELAKINTPIEETLTDLFGKVSKDLGEFSAVMVLFVEFPFRTARHIDMAANSMQLFNTDRVIGVRPETDIFYQHNGKTLVEIGSHGGLRLERDDIYRQTGGFVLIRRGHFPFRDKEKRVERIGHVVLEQQASIYLGSKWEWEIADMYAEKLALATKGKHE